MSDLTILIPCRFDANEEWLKDAVGSIPEGYKYILCRNDGELAEALNQGLKAADTEWVVRLDADDLLDVNCLDELKAACWDVDVVYPTLMMVTEDLKFQGTMHAREFCPNRLTVRNYIAGAGTLFKREKALQVGGYRDMPALEDWDLWVRMWKAGARFKAAPEAVYIYRQVANSRNKMTVEKNRELKHFIVGEEAEIKATFYVQETLATTYWRCVLPSRYLPGQVSPDPAVQNVGDDFHFPDHRGAAIWAFPGNEHERWWMAAQQEKNIPVLVETDDNYLERIPHSKAWVLKSSQSKVLPSIERHRKIVEWADGVIVTTDQLAAQYRKATKAPVFVCKNQIDPDDWKDSGLRPDWYDPDKTYVGWAASASHLADSALVGQAVDWCSKQKNVEVLVFGVDVRKDWGKRARNFRWIPWTSDISAYRQLQRVIDIGLAPVKETPWSSCRSDVKALEYAMVGAVPVLSSVTPYKDWVDGEGCRKASDAREFLHAVRELVNDPVKRKSLAEEATMMTVTDRTIRGNIDCWREAIETPVRNPV